MSLRKDSQPKRPTWPEITDLAHQQIGKGTAWNYVCYCKVCAAIRRKTTRE